MPILEVEHIEKSFENTEVLKDISFTLEKGQVLSIIGSSGSGKTTLLRCLNFLERADSGIIKVNDEVIFDSKSGVKLKDSAMRKTDFISDLYFSLLIFFRNIQRLRMLCLQDSFWPRNSLIINPIIRQYFQR